MVLEREEVLDREVRGRSGVSHIGRLHSMNCSEELCRYSLLDGPSLRMSRS
jgi:hypothetical protein